jgi:hypothetical protein
MASWLASYIFLELGHISLAQTVVTRPVDSRAMLKAPVPANKSTARSICCICFTVYYIDMFSDQEYCLKFIILITLNEVIDFFMPASNRFNID